jgi:hypothetical protein
MTSVEPTYLTLMDIIMCHSLVIGKPNLVVSQQILVGLQHLTHLFDLPLMNFSKAGVVSEMVANDRR